MKTIMAALAAMALLAAAAAPASAEMDVTAIAKELAKGADSDAVRFVKERSDAPRFIERDASKLPFGSSEWWQQMERERGGRRR